MFISVIDSMLSNKINLVLMIKVFIIIICITGQLSQNDNFDKDESIDDKDQTNNNQDQDDAIENNIEQQCIRKFIQWLFKYGAEVNNVAIDYTQSDNRIVIATEFISEGSRILFIPHKLLITLDRVKQNLLFQELVKNERKMKAPLNTYLALQILYEKANPFSPFKPYLDVLPQNYNTFPLFYNETQLKCFKGSPFLQEIDNYKKELQYDYKIVLKYVPEFSVISYDEFLWARTTSCSRIFSLNISGVVTEGFVPLADLFNHEADYQGHWGYSDEEQGFYVNSLENIEEGGEIFVSYGNKDNHRLLLHYGFIQGENDIKTCYLDVEIRNDYPLISQKQQIIYIWYKKNIGQKVRFALSDDLNEQTNINFINLIRFLQEHDASVIEQYHKEDAVIHSLDNELKVWKFIKQQVQKQLDSYEINEEDMNKFMNDQELDMNIENCLIIILEEQEILNYYLQMSNQTISLIENLDYLNQNLREQYIQEYQIYYDQISHLLDYSNDDL
ncbi:hypothetical protein pb186bvf_014048 [Paramecium bursaria]